MELDLDKIEEIMDKKNIGTLELAVLMEVSQSWVYNVLAGTAGKTFKTADKIAKALNVNPKSIIK
jgi:plasmid maintenance system antidote protein VapI